VGRALVLGAAVWFSSYSLYSVTAKSHGNVARTIHRAIQMRYRWNTDEKDLPLLEMDGDGSLVEGEVSGFGYPMDGLSFQILGGLRYDDERKVYELPLVAGRESAVAVSEDGPTTDAASVVFERAERTSIYKVSDRAES
jgi:hypothetical protein